MSHPDQVSLSPEDFAGQTEANAAATRNFAEIVPGSLTMDEQDELASTPDKARQVAILAGLGTTASAHNRYVVVTQTDEHGNEVPARYASLKENDFAIVSTRLHGEKHLPPLEDAPEVAARQAALRAEFEATRAPASTGYTPSAHIGKPWEQILSLHRAIDAQRVAAGKEPYYGYGPEEKK